jgi:ABC-type nickel/cobalt efflux system permease component RcnA
MQTDKLVSSFFVTVIVTVMAFHRLGRKHECQNRENKRLDRRDDEFQTDEDHRQHRSRQERHNDQQNTAREHVTEKTEGKADHLTDFRDDLEDTNHEVNRAERFLAQVTENFWK